MEETAKSRLLLILKYGDICFAPGFKTDKGYKLIVSDPEDQVKIDNVNYFYHMMSSHLSGLVYDQIPEDKKQDASIIFKVVLFNDVTFIEEKDVYKYEKEERASKYSDPKAFILVDNGYLEPIPIIV